MKICMIGKYLENLEEGMRNVSFHLAKELTKRHQVLTLDLRAIFTMAFWKDITVFNPDIVHYFYGPSIKSILLLKVISLYCRDAKTVTFAILPDFSFLSKQFIPVFKPDLVLIQSFETEEFFKKLGCKTEFLPCGADVKKFIPVTTKAKEELRERYGIDKEKFVILHVGHISEGRNVQSLKKLQNENNQVVIIGSTTSTGINQLICEQLKKSGCFVWTRYFEDIEEIYALSDCYIFTTLPVNKLNSIEMPLSVLEAMSCNLPVITTKFGALQRVFKEGNGLFFADEEKDFIIALESIKNSDTDVKTRDKVMPYSWENIGKELEEIYLDLMGGGNK